jgi:hypothetical protein
MLGVRRSVSQSAAEAPMTWPEGVALELILLGIGWMGFKFLTREIRGFLDLRREIRRELQRFAMAEARRSGERTPPGGEAPAADEPDPENGTEVFRQLGFRMLSFAQNARLAAWTVRMMGYDPIKAGDNLISLSHDTGLAFRRKYILDALRFTEGMPADDH